MISGGYRCPLYDDDAAVTTADLGSDQATRQLDSALATTDLLPAVRWQSSVGASFRGWRPATACPTATTTNDTRGTNVRLHAILGPTWAFIGPESLVAPAKERLGDVAH